VGKFATWSSGGVALALPNELKAVPLRHRAGGCGAFWGGSPVRQDFSTFIIVVAVLMVTATRVFPEAGVKKGSAKRMK
jgi:N-methylhydantoinase B/oxoprolinase/acetone carboxylase alpha subunit